MVGEVSLKQIRGREVISYLDNHCARIVSDPTGWQVLYKDMIENEYWLLTYPDSETSGSGEPLLSQLSKETAQQSIINLSSEKTQK